MLTYRQLDLWQCWKFTQVRQSKADSFGGGPGNFYWFFFNFMFMIWLLTLTTFLTKFQTLASGHKLKWNLKQNAELFFQENAFKNVICKTATILFRIQCVDWILPRIWQCHCRRYPLIAKFMGPIWGPPGADRTQVGPVLVPWIWVTFERISLELNSTRPRCVDDKSALV